MRVFKEMEGQGIVPDVVAHNAAIAACAKVRTRGSCCGQQLGPPSGPAPGLWAAVRGCPMQLGLRLLHILEMLHPACGLPVPSYAGISK